MELNAGSSRVEIDPATGAISRLEDRATGLVHVRENPDALLFRITVPRGIWTSRYADNTMARPAVVRHDARSVLLRWANLPAADGPSGLDVDVLAEAVPAANEVRFRIDIRNAGDERVVEVHFPLVSGWTGLGGKGADRLVLGGRGEEDPHRFPVNTGTTYANVHQRSRADYPMGLYLPWVDLSGPGGGLSYVHYMPQPQMGSFVEANLSGHGPGMRLAFGWRTPCVIAPGESWRSAPVGIATHGGDWHVTADRYAAWMDTWFHPPPTPPGKREIIGFQNVFLRGFDGWPLRGLGAIPAIAADGRRFGVNDLCIWDEVTLGNYERMDGRDLFSYTPDEKDTLRRGLREAREAGTNVNALVNVRLIPGGSRLAQERMGEALRLMDGSLYTENYGLTHHSLGAWCRDRGPNCYISSPAAESYCQRVLEWTREYLDLGYVSMFYDQPFELMSDYGRLDRGHRPEDTYAATLSLLAEVRQLVHRNNPDGYLIGEFCEGFMAQHIDLWMAWYREVGQAMMAAYSIPRTMHSWVVDSDAGQASRAFAMGMYLCLCTHGNEATLADEPAFGEHVRRLAELRKRTADRTVHARFRGDQGITVRADGPAEAYAFDGPLGPTVIATSSGQAGQVTVAVDRARFQAPGGSDGKVFGLDGQERPHRGDELTIRLAADDVAVWAL